MTIISLALIIGGGWYIVMALISLGYLAFMSEYERKLINVRWNRLWLSLILGSVAIGAGLELWP